MLTATGTPGVFTINSVGTGSLTSSTAATSNYFASSVTRTFPVVNTPVEGISDLLVGKSTSYSNTTITVNDSTRYSLYQAVTNLSGSFEPTRFVDNLKEAPRYYQVYFLVSDTWVKKIDLNANGSLTIDSAITGVSGATQMKRVALGYNIQLKEVPGGNHLYGQ